MRVRDSSLFSQVERISYSILCCWLVAEVGIRLELP